MFSFYFHREWKSLWARRGSRFTIGLFVLLCLWALVGGLRWQAQTTAALAEKPADLFIERDTWIADLEKAEAGEEVSPFSARPMGLTIPAARHPEPLAALAFRRESIHPHAALVSGWKSEASLFRRYEVQGSSVLQAGLLDLAFVVTVLLPLFLLLLSFNVLSSERESGRLALFLAQGGDAAMLSVARLLVLAIPLLCSVALCVLACAAINGATVGETLMWLGMLLAYTAFWAGVALCIATWFTRQVAGALAVLAAWSIVVVLIPSGAQFVAQAWHPLPPKVSYLSEARDAEASTRRSIAERAEVYMAEHPGQYEAADDAVPGFYRAAYLANIDINERTAPLVAAIEARQLAQRELVALAAYLSPALALQDGLYSLSGTGPAFSAEFRRQARDYLGMLLAQIGPATVSRNRMTVEAARSIPGFSFVRTPNAGAVLRSALWMLLLGSLFAWLGLRRASALP